MSKITYREISYKGIRISAIGNLHLKTSEMIQQWHLPSDIAILDLGAGEGAFCARLQDMGFNNIEACEIVPGKFIVDGIICHHIDLNGLDFADHFGKKYDLIIAQEIIEHLENPSCFFRNIGDLLKPGGLCILTTPNTDSWYSRLLFLRKGEIHWFNQEQNGISGHIHPIFDWQVDVLSKLAGLSIHLTTNSDDSLLLKRYIYPKGFLRAMFTRTTYLYFILRLLMDNPGRGEIRIWVLKKQ